MGDKKLRFVMTAIDYGTAVAAVMGFLHNEELPPDATEHQLAFLEKLIVNARKRLQEQEQSGG